MKLITKQEVANKLGKFDFFDSLDRKLKGSATYLSGIALMDESNNSFGMGHYSVNFEYRPCGLEIEVDQPWEYNKLALLLDEIDFITIEPCEQVIEKRDKSIIGRAILGGLAFGAVGAIVGAMTGLKPKEVVITGIHNILLIKHKVYHNSLILSVDNKHYQNLERFFLQCFPKHYKYPNNLPVGSKTSDRVDQATI